MNDAFVYVENVFQSSEIETASFPNNIDIVGMDRSICKSADHGTGDMEKVGVNEDGSSRSTEILFNTMGGCTIFHQRPAELEQIVSSGDNVGDLRDQTHMILK